MKSGAGINPSHAIRWIGDDNALEAVCDTWKDAAILAVDTEFMRSRTYYPLAGLIQVNDGQHNYLLDPTTIDDFYPLIDILDDDKILKVLHSCSEDLEVFQHALGCLPRNIFDTQLAAALAGFGFSMGYANLVKAVLDLEIPKSETRSDWLQRPLSEAQLRYAAIDVEYLFILAQRLIEMLKDKSRLDWAMQDSEAMVKNFFDNQDPDKSFLRIKSAWKLDRRQLAILQGITRWREDRAQEKNVPRNRIIKESAIMTLAQMAPTELRQLKGIEGLTDRMIRHHGEKMIAIVEQAYRQNENTLPQRLPVPLKSREKVWLERLKQANAKKAGDLGMPSEILCRRKDLEHVIIQLRDGGLALPVALGGWRREIIGEELLSLASAMRDEVQEE